MKKGIFVLLVVLLGSTVVMQQEQLKESKRLVLDLQDTIRMMEDEVNQAYSKLDEIANKR